MPGTRRGRPLKFGRPTQVLTLTLPQDVVDWLTSMHPDPAWAIVSLHDRLVPRDRQPRRRALPRVELARLRGRQALIVVDPSVYRALPGVSVIPVAAGRAFLAFDAGRGVADLELAILDRLEQPGVGTAERRGLESLLGEVRGWRRARGYRFSTRSIILVEERKSKPRNQPEGPSSSGGETRGSTRSGLNSRLRRLSPRGSRSVRARR
jgi:hypothetical protein